MYLYRICFLPTGGLFPRPFVNESNLCVTLLDWEKNEGLRPSCPWKRLGGSFEAVSLQPEKSFVKRSFPLVAGAGVGVQGDLEFLVHLDQFLIGLGSTVRGRKQNQERA